MTKSIIILAALTTLVSAPAAWAQDKASQKFLTEAIEGNYAEVEMGRLAQQNGQSTEVKSFGQMLATDHASANEKALEAAKVLRVTPPAGPNAKQKADAARMAKLNGAAFDKAFAQHMVMDHKKDIAAYDKQTKKNDAAAQYASGELPTLRKHLDTATSLEKAKTAPR
jgi:putative membrane protein